MELSISAVALLLVVVLLLVKKSGLKPPHAVVCGLFGFFLASSSLAPTISGGVSNVAQMLSGISL